MTNTREPKVQPIPILTLRPTQMTVGMREVKDKRKRFREEESKKRREMIGKHMIPVVVGPDERLYVVDHHHLARALHDEGVKGGFKRSSQHRLSSFMVATRQGPPPAFSIPVPFSVGH